MTPIVSSSQAPEVVNTEHLPSGLGCRYLECLDDRERHGTFIATRWRRKPCECPRGSVLVDYGPNAR